MIQLSSRAAVPVAAHMGSFIRNSWQPAIGVLGDV
jgi:hypothetical protein